MWSRGSLAVCEALLCSRGLFVLCSWNAEYVLGEYSGGGGRVGNLGWRFKFYFFSSSFFLHVVDPVTRTSHKDFVGFNWPIFPFFFKKKRPQDLGAAQLRMPKPKLGRAFFCL